MAPASLPPLSSLSPPPPQRIELLCGSGPDEGMVRMPAQPDSLLPFAARPDLMASPGGGGGSDPESSSLSGDGSYGRAGFGAPGSAMACHRTAHCTKSAGHQGFCSGHKGFRRREGGLTLSYAAVSGRNAKRPRAAERRPTPQHW